MRTMPFLTLLAALLAAACGGPAPAPFKPIADNKVLMQTIVDPSADLIWDAVKTIDTAEGSQDIRPKTDEEWALVRNAAVTVAESGNLIMMSPRAKDGGEWMLRAQEMITAGEAALRAAEAKNAEKLFTVGGDIYDSCSNCHRKYLDAIVNANK